MEIMPYSNLSYFAEYLKSLSSSSFSEDATFYSRWVKENGQEHSCDFTPNARRLLALEQQGYEYNSNTPEPIAAEETCILRPDNVRFWWKFNIIWKTISGSYEFRSYSGDFDTLDYNININNKSYECFGHVERNSPQYILDLASSDIDFNTYYNNLPEINRINICQHVPSWHELSTMHGWCVMPYTPCD